MGLVGVPRGEGEAPQGFPFREYIYIYKVYVGSDGLLAAAENGYNNFAVLTRLIFGSSFELHIRNIADVLCGSP